MGSEKEIRKEGGGNSRTGERRRKGEGRCRVDDGEERKREG